MRPQLRQLTFSFGGCAGSGEGTTVRRAPHSTQVIWRSTGVGASDRGGVSASTGSTRSFRGALSAGFTTRATAAGSLILGARTASARGGGEGAGAAGREGGSAAGGNGAATGAEDGDAAGGEGAAKGAEGGGAAGVDGAATGAEGGAVAGREGGGAAGATGRVSGLATAGRAGVSSTLVSGSSLNEKSAMEGFGAADSSCSDCASSCAKRLSNERTMSASSAAAESSVSPSGVLNVKICVTAKRTRSPIATRR
jgi:hypothetical protein